MQAILGLAQLYLTGGKGVPLDIDAAAKYFMVAADAGNSQALGYLGKMYLEGTMATPQNNLTAFQYFKKAADKGNAVGQTGLGMMFLYGYVRFYSFFKLFYLMQYRLAVYAFKCTINKQIEFVKILNRLIIYRVSKRIPIKHSNFSRWQVNRAFQTLSFILGKCIFKGLD